MDFLRNCGAPAAEGGLVYSTCQHLRAIGKYQKTVQKVAGSIPALRAKQVVQLVRTFEGCKSLQVRALPRLGRVAEVVDAGLFGRSTYRKTKNDVAARHSYGEAVASREGSCSC